MKHGGDVAIQRWRAKANLPPHLALDNQFRPEYTFSMDCTGKRPGCKPHCPTSVRLLMRPILFAIIATLLVGCASSRTRTHQAASPFSRYDDDFQSSIRTSWEALSHGKNRAGEIVLEFHLTSDGQITDMKVVKDGVGNGQSLICEKAVLASVPYPPWPADMVRMVGESFRVYTFAFNY
jgi:hypothetical protein